MKSSFFEDIDILGMDYSPGQLILVGGENWDMTHYVLSNCILEGLKDVPVLYFCGKNMLPVSDDLVNMEAESYYDGEDLPSVSYIIGRIFHMVEKRSVGCVVVDIFQGELEGPMRSRDSRLNTTLRLLKTVAEETSTFIIVLSRINSSRKYRHVSDDDILEMPFEEVYCDQVILIDKVERGMFDFILARGLSVIGHETEYAIKVELFSDIRPYRKKGAYYADGKMPREGVPEISSFGRWINKGNRSWAYGFLDAEGTEWSISVNLVGNEEKCRWNVSFLSTAGYSYMHLFPPYRFEELDKLKDDALLLALQMFPGLV